MWRLHTLIVCSSCCTPAIDTVIPFCLMGTEETSGQSATRPYLSGTTSTRSPGRRTRAADGKAPAWTTPPANCHLISLRAFSLDACHPNHISGTAR